MPEIKLTNVTKRWGKFYAVENLDLDIEDNSFITLLGPSGCGKTTTLRMIAGLETPTSGRITIGDRVVFDSDLGINVPANKRKVGFLFQNYALWPNMTVYDNIAFGLKNVKDSLPSCNFEAKRLADIIRVLEDADNVANLINECRDKNGKIDETRAKMLIIDNYTVSMATAKSVYSYKLQEKDSPATAALDIANGLKIKLNALVEDEKSRGFTLDEEYRRTTYKDVKVGENPDGTPRFEKRWIPVTSQRKLSKEEIDLAVRRVSRIVKIGMFMDRYPAELSGGQQQRVAIARTLAPEPTVLFMDEPLSNLDAKLRLEMRYELQRLHVETGSTFVYVTHDQMEAMTLATKICLINNGVLQQYEAPLTVYNTPANLFVADFVGNPSINFVEATGTQGADGSINLNVFGKYDVSFKPATPFSLSDWIAKRNADAQAAKDAHAQKLLDKKYVEKGNKDEVFKYNIIKIEEDYGVEDTEITDNDFVLGIRPEFIDIVTGAAISDTARIDGEIYGVMPTGMETTLKIRVDNFLLTSVKFGGDVYSIGTSAALSFKGDGIMLFDRTSGKLVATGSLK